MLKSKKLTRLEQAWGQYDAYLLNTMERMQTALKYSNYIELFLSRFPKRTDPKQFDRVDYQDFRAYCKARGWSSKFINLCGTAVRDFWDFMLRRGYVETQIAQAADRPVAHRLSVEGLKKAWARIETDSLLRDFVVELYHGRNFLGGRGRPAVIGRWRRKVREPLAINWLTPKRFVENFRRLQPAGMELTHSPLFPDGHNKPFHTGPKIADKDIDVMAIFALD